LEYRALGASDLTVSAFGLGVMTFGGQTPEDDAFRQLDLAFEAGVTLFDTAENYPIPTGPATQGRSEEVLGRWIASRGVRDRVVIATKVAGPGNAAGDMRHIRGEARRLDAANINQAIDASLRRLGTDHVDLYQLHWPERAISTTGRVRYSRLRPDPGEVPIAETLGAFADLVAAGKVRAIGVCNESPWGVMRFLGAADSGAGPPIAAIQNGYNLLDRSFELGLAEVCEREQLGLIAYSPLARGTLTGKYRADPSGSDTGQSAAFAARMLSPGKRTAIERYAALADEAGIALIHMALAFVAAQPFTASVLVAGSNVAQLAGNLGAIDVALAPELAKAINAIHDSHPNPR
jgi:aryl-alcohol dehydrogenase-like predicted oxidoreductase